MRNFSLIVASLVVVGANAVELRDVVKGTYIPERIDAMTPLADGKSYAQIENDGTTIVSYSYKSGKKLKVLFDANSTKGESVKEIDDFIISPDGQRIIIQTDTKRIYRRSASAVYYVYDVTTKVLRLLTLQGAVQSPIWSGDSRRIAFVKDNNIFLVDIDNDFHETQVTFDGKRNEVINGIPDWVNEEEFALATAMTFSSDNGYLCWIRYDESRVKEYHLEDYVYKYPEAGEENSRVSAHSYNIYSGKTSALQVPVDSDGYMPRIKPIAQAARVVVYTMNRHQDTLRLNVVNLETSQSYKFIEEHSDCYVKEEAMELIIIGKKYSVVPSDRSGSMQLYLYSQKGECIRQLTDIDGEVTDVYALDEENECVYYQATMGSPMNRGVYVTPFFKGSTKLLTPREGWNEASFSASNEYFVNIWSDRYTPYRYSIYDNKGKEVKVLVDNKELSKKLQDEGVPSKEFFTFTTSEGISLNGVMIKPVNFDATKKYPVIMWQYSGPGSQQVVNSWQLGSMRNGALYDMWLTEQGFIVVCVDGRGTGGRGADFEKCTYLKLGDLESKDQVEAALYLASLPYIDAARIGIWGWSYGGFNTLMSMSEGRQVFKAGVAVAPPTDWRFYDTVYTERYMRTPQENKEGYDDNPINRASKLSGSLLLCHGTKDDNVHPINTIEYSEALVQADKDFKENLYKGRNHSIYGGNTRHHLLRQIYEFFKTNL